MHITLSAFISLINLSLTFALTTPTPNNSSTNTTITPPTRYYLKTRVLYNGNTDKNDLFVSSYHTGPFTSLSLFSALSHITHSVHNALSPLLSLPHRRRPKRRNSPSLLHFRKHGRLPQRHASAIRPAQPRPLGHDYGAVGKSGRWFVRHTMPSLHFSLSLSSFPSPEICWGKGICTG